jgi:hypothetical protein
MQLGNNANILSPVLGQASSPLTICSTGGFHLAIDAVGARHGGAAVVLESVVKAALENGKVKKLTVFSPPKGERQFSFPVSSQLSEEPIQLANRVQQISWLVWGLPQKVKRLNPDALLCLPNGGLTTPETPSAVFVQQSVPFCRKALRTVGLRGRLRMMAIRKVMHISCNRARHVIVQSQTMREALRDKLRIPESRTEVIPPSVQAEIVP